MKIELRERELDEYRNKRGGAKRRYWRENKEAIIAQGLQDEGRRQDRDEFLNREKKD